MVRLPVSPLYWFCLLVFFLFFCPYDGVLCSSSLLISASFQTIKNSHGERLVFFYFASDSKSEPILSILEKTAKKIRKTLPHFQFYKCDGDLPENHADFADASFNSGYFIFSSVPVEGILKYTGEVNVNALVSYIQSKYLPSDEEALLAFTDETQLFQRIDDTDTQQDGQPILRPAFLWFTETWCDMCKRLRPALTIAATYFASRGLDVIEVKCSDNEAATEFCTRQQVRKFPTLILFTGENKHIMSDEIINVIQMEKFAEKHLLTANSDIDADEEDSDAAHTESWNSFQKIRQEDNNEKKKVKRKDKEKLKDESTELNENEESAHNEDKKKAVGEKTKRGKFARQSPKKQEKEQQQPQAQYSPDDEQTLNPTVNSVAAHSQSPTICSANSGVSASGCEDTLTLNALSESLHSLKNTIELLEERVRRLESKQHF